MKRRVAVIGAGLSGLTAIKCCLEEGLQPVCFEQSDEIGGLWRFKEEPQDGQASIYQSLTTNTSKEMMCYSDFPFPAHVPNYLHHSKVLEYLHSYARHFDLLRHICFKTLVRSVKKRPDFTRSGQWEVVTVNSEGLEESAIFDGVLVCAGHHTYPHLPLQDFPGVETFEGQYLHSRNYKRPERFQGKRVVVIGMRNSAVDIAVELSRVTEQVFLSTRSGSWLISRIAGDGFPTDVFYNTRLVNLLQRLLPFTWVNWLAERHLQQRVQHRLYGIQPRHRALSRIPTLNDELPSRIICGAVVVKPNVKELRGSSVVFEDGTVEDRIDVVIFATGYKVSFPFLDPSLVPVSKSWKCLYKHVFPAALERPTLAFIGLASPRGSLLPVCELQSRWSARVIAGSQTLPPAKVLNEDIEKKSKVSKLRLVASQWETPEEDFISYMDELAVQIGVRPSVPWLFLRDPRLAKAVLLGPCTPYQYRLSGPGKWAGARGAILTQWARIKEPLRARRCCDDPQSFSGLLFGLTAATVLCVAVTCYVQWQHPALLPGLLKMAGPLAL
ncbi:dimethylaniline monooxygenase [N-oxide-forming] 2-like [Erpetoichthys calabaricus]|uniref:dimethylaniline monooxygenase [N-oxide-forming] 2-like n=1 Tax=Erpetoichthys calabaricus TaxID=27687 RepID=UPI00109F4FB3|nr:dimethylaniline monooxygenase [N-oxide-forming] 2-like [Erpetoichthys calabaricus]